MELQEYLRNYSHIHLVGVGGVSMSALAKICLNNNVYVSGSDSQKTEITEELRHLGVNIFYKHNVENIKGADLVVYTSAVGEDNCEVVQARKYNIEVLERTDFLHNICNQFSEVIAVSGTHGKTTTTAMIGCIFEKAKLNPTVHLGGSCENFNGNLRLGGKQFLILEACEYQKHLLKIPHTVGVILNMELDHAECYKNIFELQKTFNKFANNSTKITIMNEKNLSFVNRNNKYITFSEKCNGNFCAKNIELYQDGKVKFTCYKNLEFYGKFKLNCFGIHNVYNALSAIAVADFYNIDYKYIYEGLSEFKGIKRRFEYMGKINNQIVVHDYAHHPTEIETAIETARQIFKKPVLVVFQPHTYSRTKYLFSEFVSKLNLADEVVVMPTYPARETKKQGYDAKKLFYVLKKLNKKNRFFYSYNKIKNHLNSKLGYTILILGAGDIENLAKSIKKDYISKK